jgi:hypothetical protein
MKIQHQPIRIPKGWKDQDAALVMQIDRLIEDLYQQIAQLKERIKAIEEEA